MLPKEYQKNICKRVHYAVGQLNAIEKMITSGRKVDDILIQFLAVEGALNKIVYQHLDEALRKSLALKINALFEHKNLSPECRQTLIAIREKFPLYKLRQLPKVLFDLHQIEQKYMPDN